ncbi:MAG: BrnT family toxin [Acidobacteriaceae bacterium]|jgi:uncharacterized DUF497 family protein
MRFEYDERKNRHNLLKHGVDFRTAEIVFEDAYALTRRDEIHDEEERFITLGEIAAGGCCLWFTRRLPDGTGKK